MISLGLIFAGICNLLFTFITASLFVSYIVYALTGFFLSMIYAPMTKVVAENTEPLHATRCSLGYTFASFLGSPTAGILASILVWQRVFNFSSSILIIMGMVCFLCFFIFEKKQIVKYNQYTAPVNTTGGV